MVVRDEISKKVVGIKCKRCEVTAPSAEELIAGGGLNNMGWHCYGGTHLCPAHVPGKEET